MRSFCWQTLEKALGSSFWKKTRNEPEAGHSGATVWWWTVIFSVVKKYAGNMTSGVRPLGGGFWCDAPEGTPTSRATATKALVSVPRMRNLCECRLIVPPATPGVTFYTLRTSAFRLLSARSRTSREYGRPNGVLSSET